MVTMRFPVITALCSLLIGCAPPTTGGLLSNASPTKSDGITCTVGNKIFCLEQISTDSAGCPTLGRFTGHTRAIKVAAITPGKRYAVLFEKIVTPLDGRTPVESPYVGTFSELQSTAEMGCDSIKTGAQTYFIQLKYVCSRELVGNASSPSPSELRCTGADPGFDPNLLPAQPTVAADSPVRNILVQYSTRPSTDLINVDALSCQRKCEDLVSGACVRVRVPPKVLAGLVAPALPIDGSPHAQRTYQMSKLMMSLDVASDPCQRGDLFFKTGTFENAGGACSVSWDAPALGGMTIAVPANVVGKLDGNASTLVVRFPDISNSLSVSFGSKDLSALNGPVSSIEISNSALYANLSGTCVGIKESTNLGLLLHTDLFLTSALFRATNLYSKARHTLMEIDSR